MAAKLLFENRLSNIETETYRQSSLPVTGNACNGAERVLTFKNAWRARIFTKWCFPDEILRAWDDLARRRGDIGIFLESGWFEQWWHAMGREGKLFVTVVEHADELRGIFPCWITPNGRLQALADDYHYDFLLAYNERDQTIEHFIEVILRKTNGSAYLQWFPDSSEMPFRLPRQLRAKFIPVGIYSRPSAPYLKIDKTWPEYLERLNTKLKANIRRRRRLAEKEGPVNFEIVHHTNGLDDLLTGLFEVEARNWKGTQGTAIKCNEDTEALYRRIARWAMASGRLRLCMLRFDGQVVAFDFCLAEGKTVFLLKTGYDESAGRFSPGILLRYAHFEHLFQTGDFETFDFLGPWYDWKREWTQTGNQYTSLEIYRRTIPDWGRYMRKYGWKAPLKRSKYLAAFVNRRRPQ